MAPARCAVAARAHAAHHLGTVQLARAERHFGAVQPSARRTSARLGVSPARRTTSEPWGPSGLGRRFAPSTTSEPCSHPHTALPHGPEFRPRGAPPRAVAPVRVGQSFRAERHLGPWRPSGARWQPGPVSSTTSGRGARPVRGGGQGRCRAPPRGRGACPRRAPPRSVTTDPLPRHDRGQSSAPAALPALVCRNLRNSGRLPRHLFRCRLESRRA